MNNCNVLRTIVSNFLLLGLTSVSAMAMQPEKDLEFSFPKTPLISQSGTQTPDSEARELLENIRAGIEQWEQYHKAAQQIFENCLSKSERILQLENDKAIRVAEAIAAKNLLLKEFLAAEWKKGVPSSEIYECRLAFTQLPYISPELREEYRKLIQSYEDLQQPSKALDSER